MDDLRSSIHMICHGFTLSNSPYLQELLDTTKYNNTYFSVESLA